jgi:hypothetical protein
MRMMSPTMSACAAHAAKNSDATAAARKLVRNVNIVPISSSCPELIRSELRSY